jgi:hypothetical protein
VRQSVSEKLAPASTPSASAVSIFFSTIAPPRSFTSGLRQRARLPFLPSARVARRTFLERQDCISVALSNGLQARPEGGRRQGPKAAHNCPWRGSGWFPVVCLTPAKRQRRFLDLRRCLVPGLWWGIIVPYSSGRGCPMGSVLHGSARTTPRIRAPHDPRGGASDGDAPRARGVARSALGREEAL